MALNLNSDSRVRRWAVALLLVLGLGTLLRLLHLDADPVYRLWAGYITDEGRWTAQARRFVLDGSLEVGGWTSLHLLLAPLFQATTALSFWLSGAGLVSARLVSALSSVLMLGAAFLFLRRGLSTGAFALTLAILAIQPDLLFFGRVAIPEMSAMFLAFTAFICLSSYPAARGRIFFGGLLTAVAIGFKMTLAPLVAIFALVAVTAGDDEDPKGRVLQGLAFVAGVALPALALVISLAWIGGQVGLGWLVSGLEDLTFFLRLETPYEAISAFLYGDLVGSITPILLGCWLVGGLLIAAGTPPRGSRGNLYFGSLIWVVGWIAVSLVLDYFPDRYFIHLVLPLALNLGAGLTTLQEAGMDRLRDAVDGLRGGRRPLTAFWIALPAAVILAPVFIAAADLADFGIDRMRQQLLLLAALALVLGWAVLRWWGSRLVFQALALLLLATSLQWVGVRSGIAASSFWQPGVSGGVTSAVAFLGAAGAVALARNHPARAVKASAALFVGAVVTGWLWLAAPQILVPTYTIRESADLVEELAAPDDRIGTRDAGGILLETRLRYTEQLLGATPVDLLVVVFDQVPPGYLARYHLTARRELNLGPEIDERRGMRTELKVYRLNDVPGTAGTPEVPAAPSDS